MAETIIERSTQEMYIEDKCKYAIVIDRRRAFPEIRDGLKIVQRRILYAAYTQGMTSPNKRAKSASLTGELMKNYHPHGSAYDSIASMVQWFKNKIPLMYGKGNWGSVDGSGPAAERYTECALNEFGYEVMISELAESKNIVNWLDTFNRNGIQEPEYLPCKLPMLLINGTDGIGVGLSVNLPTHNINEVLDATIKLLHNPNSEVVLVPDHCQQCFIIDTDWKKISTTGSGSYKVRGNILTEQDKKGNYTLRVISLPNGVSIDSVYQKILELVDKKKLLMIKDVIPSIENSKPNLIIELRTGVDPEYVKQVLYAMTQIQVSERVNFEAVKMNGIDIGRFSYKDYLLSFIEQRMIVKFRLYCNKLQKAITRHHYIDAFIKVLDSGEIHKIISMIEKADKDEEYMKEWIIKHCKTTDIQATYILNTNLKNLSMKNLKRYKEERKELEAKINEWTPKVSDDGTLIRKEIEEELKYFKQKFGQPRLCKVISASEGNNIPAGTFKIVITEKNFVRKIPDVDKINVIRKDNPKFILKVDNTENILIFDNLGKVYNLPVHKIPVTEKTGPGMDIRVLVKNLTSDIVAVFYEPLIKQLAKGKNKHRFIVMNKDNLIKRLDIEDFLNVSASGLIYTKIKDQDQVKSVQLAPDNLDLVMCTDRKALRCKVSDIPILKRNAQGVKGMNSTEPLEGLSVIYPDADYIVVLTKNGKMNRFTIDLLSRQNRARKGSNVIKLEGNDEIFGIYAVNMKDVLHVLTTEGVVEIPVADIKEKSNIAKGDKKISSLIVKADVTR